MKPSENAAVGWLSGLFLATLLGAGSALYAGTSLPLLVLSILGSASVLMPLCWALRLLRPSSMALAWLAATFGNSLWLLSTLGAQLHGKTHHRPLGGATFAVVAAAIFIGCGSVAARAVSLSRSPLERTRRLGMVLGIVLLLLGGLGTLSVVNRALSSGAIARHSLVELLLTFLCAGVGAWLPVPRFDARWLRWLGPAVWLGVLGLGSYLTAIKSGSATISPVLTGLLPLFR